MTKKQTKNFPEIITFSKKDAALFMEAVKNASRRNYITNDSIFMREDKKSFEIHPTCANFLLEVGREYQKLLDQYKK